MTRHLYLLDFDRTLFDSERFLTDTLELLHNQTGLDIPAFRTAMPTWREGELYFFYDQVKTTCGLNPTQLEHLVSTHLGDDYVFADVAPWLATRQPHDSITIVTVGLEPFQQLKFNHARILAGLPRIILQINKGTLLASGWQEKGTGRYHTSLATGEYNQVTLVDDNPATFVALGTSLPINTYHLARPGQLYANLPTPTGTRRISQLNEINSA